MRNYASWWCFALLVMGGARASSAPAEGGEPPGLDLLTVARWTLERDPNVAIEQARVDSARGGLVSAQGDFDPVISSSATWSDDRGEGASGLVQRDRSLDTTLGLSQLLPNGLVLEPEISLGQAEDVTAGASAVQSGTVTFRLRQPLLRGRGRWVTTARRAAAEQELAAATLDLEQRIAERLAAVVSGYWNWAAAERNVAVLRESEARSRSLLETTRVLIDADQVPAAELVQLEANLAAKESSTFAGEQAEFAARQVLGREVGLDAAEIAALSRPTDPFPAVAAEPLSAAPAAAWVAGAVRRRADHRAAEMRREGAEILRRAAASDLLPVLDLVFAPSYSGRDVGSGPSRYFGPLFRNVPGASATLGLSFQWPTRNRTAEGALIQAEASARQSTLAVAQIAKSIGANVPAALDGVVRSAQRLDKARQAVRLFERAVINEEKKLKAGSSTLVDLISQQDRLTAARQSEVAAELAVALAVVQLRLETGTLFGRRGTQAELDGARLTTVPELPFRPGDEEEER